MVRHFPLAIVTAMALMAVLGRADDGSSKPSARPVSFADDIRPLFEVKCWRCHGEKVHKGELDLRTAASILKGGESGPAIVPGQPDDSLLYEKVHGGVMPPSKKDRLSESEVAMIRRWIAGGAKSDAAATEAAIVEINQHQALPILRWHCAPCHGQYRQEAGLDLRSKATMLRGGKSGPALVLGTPEESLLIKKLRAGAMPPFDRLIEVSVKVVDQSEIDLLAKWIAAGAPEVSVKPDVATTSPDPLVTDKDRAFWAFQPPRAAAVPTVQNGGRVRNPVDAFILQKLEAKGLGFAREADRATLLRRAYFDLTGLPPEPAEVQAFLAENSPDAYERLIDRLLASPRYGERWGRHWLDVAGYADSEGKREQDLPRPHAWRYRDYVIRAFNNDKPYDWFLLEQIAGDELTDYEHASTITPEIYDNLVATGFLRMAPDPTWANVTGFLQDRVDVVADEIDVLGSAVLGLTLKCARCHSHKFDPIPQRDYYRLIDVFKGAFDENDWLKPDLRPGDAPLSQDVARARQLSYVTTAERRDWEMHNANLQREIDGLKAAPFLKALHPDYTKLADAIEVRRKALEAAMKPEPKLHALWDRGQPSPTYVYRRGDPLSLGRLVGPGVPSVLTDGKTPFEPQPPWPGAKKTGRRLAFARWLTQPNHPLTARVAINRLWKLHFGTGIVSTLGNFGKAGTLPTHPELLDWLATEFVRQGWSMKAMHRLMMTSSTYRQSSQLTPELERLDPSNTLCSRMPLVRLDAEALYDTMLLAAGRLDETRFGPPDPVQARPDGLVTPAGTERGWRRLIYVRQARKQLPTHLETFDYPQMNPNCVERRDSTVAPQALHLLNNGMIDQLAEHFARRLNHEAGPEAAKQVERAYLIALARLPSDEERRIGIDAIERLVQEWSKQAADAEAARLKALTGYCHAILNSAGFLYVD